jgi:hypothetical protein
VNQPSKEDKQDTQTGAEMHYTDNTENKIRKSPIGKTTAVKKK